MSNEFDFPQILPADVNLFSGQINDPWVNKTTYKEKEEMSRSEILAMLKIMPPEVTISLKKAANGLVPIISDEELEIKRRNLLNRVHNLLPEEKEQLNLTKRTRDE